MLYIDDLPMQIPLYEYTTYTESCHWNANKKIKILFEINITFKTKIS